MAQGLDYAWAPHPSIAAMRSRSIEFVCRYIGTNIDDGKMLTSGEYASLRAGGIDVVANVEGSAGEMRGFSAGASLARRGVAWLNSKGLNMPAGRPIYFSADWDVSQNDWPDLKAALDGAASIIGRNRVGLYGGRYAIQQAQRTGAAKWFWQTYAWSGGVWLPGTHIQQYQNGVRIDGADCDLNRAMQDDYGQWGYNAMAIDWDDPLYEQGDNTTDNKNRRVRQALQDVEKTDGVWRGAFGLDVAGIPANSPLGRMLALPAAVTAQAADLADIKNVLATIAAEPPVQVTQDQINEAVYQALKRVFGAPAS